MTSSANNESTGIINNATNFSVYRSNSNQLLLTCEQLLDEDIQPTEEDFSISIGGKDLSVNSASLTTEPKADIHSSTITLMLDESLLDADEVTVRYSPKYFFMWSQTFDEAIAPFEMSANLHTADDLLNHITEISESDKTTAEIDLSDKNTPQSQTDNSYPPIPIPEEYIFDKKIQEIPQEYEALSTHDKYLAELLDINFEGETAAPNDTASYPANENQLDEPTQFEDTEDNQEANNKVPQPHDNSSSERVVTYNDTYNTSIPAHNNSYNQITKEKVSYFDKVLTILSLFLAVAVGLILIFLVYFFFQFLNGDFSTKTKPSPIKSTQSTNNIIDGNTRCVVKHPNGRYEGECMEGKGEGRGIFYWDSGDRYKGDWLNEKKQGNGILTYHNGDSYEGQFDNNLKHGHGTMNWNSGAKYEGNYSYGKFHGEGIFWTKKGDRYEGTFHNGRFTQKGICYKRDGSSVKGPCSL